MSMLAGTTWAQTTWSLSQCIRYALDHNIQVKQQEQAVESRKIDLNTSKNRRLPGVSASLSQSFNFGRGLTMDNTYANRNTMNTSADLSAQVPVFDGGQITKDIQVKKLNLAASISDLDKLKDNMSVQVAQAYMEALYQYKAMQVSQSQLQMSQYQLYRIQRLVDAGKAAPTQLADAKATAANDELTLVQSQNSYYLAILNLTQLLELPSPEGFELPEMDLNNIDQTLLPSADEVYAQAVQIKPQVQAEQIRLEGAGKSVELAKAQKLPTVSLGGGIGTSYYNTSGMPSSPFGTQLSDNLNKYIGLQVSIPIFNRNATRNQIRSARVQQINQQLQLDQTKKDLYKEIQQAYYNAYAAQRQCASSQIALDASREAYTLMEKKYELGQATATEYQEAKTKLTRSSDNLAQSQCRFLFLQKILQFYQGIELN